MAKAGNCKVQTIRYYERIGLLPEPERSDGNQRIYRQHHMDRLGFIRHSRELGFSLERIREILALSDDPSHSCEEVDRIARNHLLEVESKIKRLQSMRKELRRMIDQCTGNQVSECRIIEVLSNHALCLAESHLDR
ncbi:MAG: helix-turn-helix domain-containing protein [Candidatus Thiodiazotropha sp. (ex Dulcina madagascariensis)]|nr:helix-turn-helix domain-containing protein [Candidatus Thiodiazotropha sp. (ex Epidulcina cf. delphinae)]MCU7924348.1 helix-turn-helix domain-containing protein [Candidatus Thiodiazotropha sp. (ex Dulcina madagascariensis)]MCU7928703.1 helix-turn-helix domain-containing protein [Candidatus Thiodiazotropha sp. (ex Dulcina madagascariensis)]